MVGSGSAAAGNVKPRDRFVENGGGEWPSRTEQVGSGVLL